MKTKSLALSLFLVAVFVMSCNEKPHKEFDKTLVEKEVRQMMNAYDDAVRKAGIEAEFDYLDNSDQFYWVPPGYKYAIHYDSVATILHKVAPRVKYIDNSWDTLQIIPLSETYASFNGIINSYAISASNDTTTTKFSETGLVIKRAKGWKYLSGQTVVIENE